jgi:hypothetical protein
VVGIGDIGSLIDSEGVAAPRVVETAAVTEEVEIVTYMERLQVEARAAHLVRSRLSLLAIESSLGKTSRYPRSCGMPM